MEAARVVEAGDVEQARGHGEVGGQMARTPEAEHSTRRGLTAFTLKSMHSTLVESMLWVPTLSSTIAAISSLA